MPRFEPFTEHTPLPAVGFGYERETFDLKLRVDAKRRFELAKDAAAFANHLGGTLLIGAGEKDGRVEKYEPLAETTANEFHSAISEAVRDRCSPRPLVMVERIYLDGGGVLLAVNVWPYIGQLVGVRVKCDVGLEGYGGDAYVFPVRVGVHSTYVKPEQLPMFMLPEVRRAVILLNRIPKGERVHVRRPRRDNRADARDFLMGDIDEEGNAVSFMNFENSRPLEIGRVEPLDKIMTVFKKSDGRWFIGVDEYE